MNECLLPQVIAERLEQLLIAGYTGPITLHVHQGNVLTLRIPRPDEVVTVAERVRSGAQ